MSNIKAVKNKSVTVNLDGKIYELRYDLNAFAELEDIYGSVEKAMDAMSTGSLKSVRTLIWAGILHNDETLTQKRVGAMITLDKLEELSKAMEEAMKNAMPENNESQNSPNK